MKSKKAKEFIERTERPFTICNNDGDYVNYIDCDARHAVKLAEEEMIEKAIEAFINHCNINYSCEYKESPIIILCNNCGKTRQFINLLNE
jgi:hypothetical protein